MDNLKKHILKTSETINNSSWNQKIEFLYTQQIDNWQMARSHYQQFQSVEKRTIKFYNFRIDIQHNPARARSTCADLSKKAIETRPCFLCANHLPEEQKAYNILNKYLLLINPFPIFERHLTISDFNHIPQQIENRIIDMLSLAKKLENFTVFYNGPLCGASAPDHFHFQAAKKGVMPIDNEINLIKIEQGKICYQDNQISIHQIENYLRTVVIFESENIDLINTYFYKALKQIQLNQGSNEPMMNILANYENKKYRLILFPRKAQRPSCYFNEGSKRILISPASVELGGLIITPREEDFHKINEEDLTDIFTEVSLNLNFLF